MVSGMVCERVFLLLQGGFFRTQIYFTTKNTEGSGVFLSYEKASASVKATADKLKYKEKLTTNRHE